MDRLRTVFMGSPEFAVPTLEALCAAEEVVAVVTQPDKPKGRRRALAPPPVKETALCAGLRVLQPERIRGEGGAEVRAELQDLAPDVIVVAAYGKILPKAVLDIPPFGCVNVHASLLPRYRGAAPIQWAIIHGETESGVTIMRMDEGMDTGPMLLRGAVPITPEETAGSLEAKLAPVGARLLLEALARLKHGPLEAEPQDHALATLAPRLAKDDGRVDFTQPAERVRDLVRGVDPWPGAFTTLGGERLLLFVPKVVSGRGAAGTVLGADRDGLIVACGSGAVAFRELQVAGRRRLPAQALLAGRAVPPGTLLGP
ncbi:MAG: methionyl-tRNA formyltransferase [Deltaproteobacteria bacterium]|nr:methionyl-tRNA formyltransferase [Deltaproteobacteria bacterium]